MKSPFSRARLDPRALFLLPLIVLFIEHAPLRVCLTSSEPIGLYLVSSGILRRGDFAQACLPSSVACLGKARGYLGSGTCPCRTRAVLKRIAALPGDDVRITEYSVLVNGRRLPSTARRASDSNGRPIPRIPPGHYQVAPDSIWILGMADPRSWDSRYFGPIPSSQVVPLKPLWVLKP